MNVLGLSCGAARGSAEILLKAALQAVQASGAAVSLIRLDELRLPTGTAESRAQDDADWLWEHLVDCDGLIVSTPIMSRTVAARLKLLGDRLLGPNADAAIIENLLALREVHALPPRFALVLVCQLEDLHAQVHRAAGDDRLALGDHHVRVGGVRRYRSMSTRTAASGSSS
ncbi:NAD(P)H-dependent oxidoreductase [Dactylosporangium sp. NBC_01737]|uniref:flavodoxin family protein n=1 Tax=Dactylosporangium sp. NBC_01737 TaxID=2975959 RepID=UPI002E107C25|nr:NAD(P)H-dependent oxidoreductase [Dactylosporangium sp. NBC_01737]